MQNYNYDLVVIGGGPGGYVAAVQASTNGLKTAIVEEDKLGGTCLHKGCIPTKTLIHGATLFRQISQEKSIGIKVDNLFLDFTKLQKHKTDTVNKLEKGIDYLLKSNKIEVFKGTGSFLSKNEIKVSNGSKHLKIKTKNVIIATGSVPIDHHPLGNRVHNSTSILNIEEIPKSIIIVGGGYIGSEFASMFESIGTHVSMVEFTSGILFQQGQAISQIITKSFQKKMDLYLNKSVEKIAVTDKKVVAKLSDNSSISAELILFAVGRKPLTEKLNLGSIGLGVNKNGFVEVNKKMETEISNIYAIGDVTGKMALAHVASKQGIVAANTMVGKSDEINYHSIPSVVYVSPEIATVGHTMESAKNAGYSPLSSVAPYSILGKAIGSNNTEGEAVLIYEKEEMRILGGYVIGQDAGNLIGELALAIRNELTIESISATVHPHPSLSEIYQEAAHLAEGFPIHLPRKKN